MRSIIYDIQDDNFPRLRIGIGGNKGPMRLTDYVIGGFKKEDKKTIEESITRAVEALECILEKGIDSAMNEYNATSKDMEKDLEQRDCNKDD